jgi:hypothetical protein
MRTQKRYYVRYRLPEPSQLPCEGVGTALHGYVSVIGLGGMFIRTAENFEVGKRLAVRLHCEEGVVEAKAVVRYAAPGGVGVEFVELRGLHEQTLRQVLGRFESLGLKD